MVGAYGIRPFSEFFYVVASRPAQISTNKGSHRALAPARQPSGPHGGGRRHIRSHIGDRWRRFEATFNGLFVLISGFQDAAPDARGRAKRLAPQEI